MAEKQHSSQVFMVEDSKEDGGDLKFRSSFSKRHTHIAIGIALLVALILLIVGIVLISKTNKDCSNAGGSTGTSTGDGATTQSPTTIAPTKPTEPQGRCAYSPEAKRIDLDGFLKEIRDSYYKIFANDVAWHPDYTTDDIRKEFRVYNHTPAALKHRSDVAKSLLDKINKKTINTDILKPREHKALMQAKHYLQFNFGMPYEGSYESGDWMLGPNSFCWQPMCSIGYDIHNGIGNLVVRSRQELGVVLKHLQDTNDTIHQYIDNMKLGIKTGMVRTMVECRGGLDAMKKAFGDLANDGANASAVMSSWFVEPLISAGFVSSLNESVVKQWKQETGYFPNETISNAIVEHIGGPIIKLLHYLEFEHALHCRPDASGPGGLSGLPIDVIYSNGTALLGSKTTKTLPIMENGVYPAINGSVSYTKILGYFTTKDISPDQVHNLGWERLKILYPQVVEIAKSVSGMANETQAIEAFQKVLVDNKVSYFNKEPLPENETTGDAFKKCANEEGAKRYCPNRWAAMQEWFKYSRTVMSLLDPKTVNLFYFTGDYHTTPNCPVKMRANFNPSSAAQSYNGADAGCTRTAYYNIPFFLKNLGPVYSEYSVNAHEARPGHHTQVQGTTEHFQDPCHGLPGWLNGQSYYTAFTEGWALYAENPLIAKETDTYKNNLMQKYGMLKWQVWRALRLIVDTGLHFKGYTRQQAIDLFGQYAWDKTDLAEKEVLRYQSNPGQATAYMIGQLDIISFRNMTATQLGENFNVKEFHYQALSQGSSPLSFLESHIKRYIACRKDTKKDGCDIVLEPPKPAEKTTKKRDLFVELLKPVHEHVI